MKNVRSNYFYTVPGDRYTSEPVKPEEKLTGCDSH